jgi:hypothetical protein
MDLLRRILASAIVLGLPAALLAPGCNQESESYPGLGNEIPNSRGGTSPGGQGDGGAALTLCTCALALSGPQITDVCNTCLQMNALPGTACVTEEGDCAASASCTATVSCVKNCNGDGPCIEACVTDPLTPKEFQSLVSCQCTACIKSCPPPQMLACVPGTPPDMPDGGDGGIQDAATD